MNDPKTIRPESIGQAHRIIIQLRADIKELKACLVLLMNQPDNMKMAEWETLRKQCENALK